MRSLDTRVRRENVVGANYAFCEFPLSSNKNKRHVSCTPSYDWELNAGLRPPPQFVGPV